MTNATKKHYVADLLNFYAIYKAENAVNAKMLRPLFNDKLGEVCATNDLTAVRSTYLINWPKASDENVHGTVQTQPRTRICH